MPRAWNFSAGPATLPEPVLAQAAEELLDWRGHGCSVMEMSHRSKAYTSIIEAAEADLRTLLKIPDEYKVLFLQGGASLQFTMLAMNLLTPGRSADYIHSGAWAQKAISAAQEIGDVRIAASGKNDRFTNIPDPSEWNLDHDAAYLHYTANETIGGVEFHDTPESGQVPLVCDMSSNILSRPIDVSQYGLIYAGAQKNIGPSGLTVVIIRDNLIGPAVSGRQASPLPGMLDYHKHAEAASMLNTPPTYAIYIAGLVFKWLRQNGGLEAMAPRNETKSKLLYDYLDSTDFYHNPIRPQDRSRMNVVFSLQDSGRDKAFLAGAEERALLGLKGHRLSGGMRASIYNAMPMEGVVALVEYMREFAARA